jgi:hypothetical protein
MVRTIGLIISSYILFRTIEVWCLAPSRYDGPAAVRTMRILAVALGLFVLGLLFTSTTKLP